MVTEQLYCMKESLNALTYATYTECCCIVAPVKTILSLNYIWAFNFLPLFFFLHLTIHVSRSWNSFRSSFCLFVYGGVILAMEGKIAMPMDEPFLDIGGYMKYTLTA